MPRNAGLQVLAAHRLPQAPTGLDEMAGLQTSSDSCTYRLQGGSAAIAGQGAVRINWMR